MSVVPSAITRVEFAKTVPGGSANVPFRTSMPPVNVFVPESVNVELPAFTRRPAPDSPLAIVMS